MKKNFLLLFCFVFISVSCKNENELLLKPVNTVNIEELKHDMPYNFDNHFAIKRYIPLETFDSCHIGEISKIVHFQKRLYVLDSFISKGVFVFDDNGKFLFKIQKNGRGPGEYLYLYDFQINKENNTIEIFDSMERKIIRYDFNGKYVNEIKMKNSIHGFYPFKNQYFIAQAYNKSYGLGNDQIYLFDGSFKMIKSYLPIGIKPELSYSNVSIFSCYEDNLYYVPLLETTIYLLNENKATPYWHFNFTNKMLTDDNFAAISQKRDIFDKMKTLESFEKVPRINNFVETKDFLMFNFSFKKQFYIGIYSKKNKNLLIGNNPSRGNGIVIPIGLKFFPYDDDICIEVEPLCFDSIIKSSLEKGSNIAENLKNISDDANPVLAIIEIRDFK